ncbi:hypothetical protein H0Z09_20920 [Pseudomonas sp. SWRI18]|uniref:OspG family effector kinase n=1 Tax=Pseudomonas sp. SWRI18 TaxID=2753888 RepID=UPI001646E30B|nr:hypothetical protein [Pseudomonas sp. SWRI18]MBC3303598.1 hypothetical protein [Pseudomonas sp. SWRI18]
MLTTDTALSPVLPPSTSSRPASASVDSLPYDATRPNIVAGFDLGQSQHWGKPASEVTSGLGRHLVAQGHAHAQSATAAVQSLLARRAPEFLVKDIPPSVTYGSLTWAQLAIATARVEAQTPGRSSSMSYVEVLAAGAPKADSGVDVQQAQRKALTDWGVVNGELPATGTPTESELARVRALYNSRLSELLRASTAVQTPVPSRKAMALNALKQAFPDVDPSLFEMRSLHKTLLKPGRPGIFPGTHSMLDIVMEGAKLGPQEHWMSQNSRIPAKRFCELYEAGTFKAAEAFEAKYKQAIQSLEGGHEDLARYLVSTMPLEDRNNFAYGKLEFFHTNDYHMAGDLFTPLALKTRAHTLQVKTTRGGEVNIYEINTREGTIKKQNYLKRRFTEPYTAEKLDSINANVVSKTTLIDPLKNDRPERKLEREVPVNGDATAASSRFDYIGKVFAKSLDLHNQDLLDHARGATSYDQSRATNAAIGEFFLNLIPFRSAIVNFVNGNHADGVFDLALDVIGLVTLGAGKAAQAGKAFAKGVSTVSGAAKAVRFVGMAAIEAFNPLGGFWDAARGGARLLKKGGGLAQRGIDALRGAPLEGVLSNTLFNQYKVPDSTITGLSRNSRGLYVKEHGNQLYIRNTDANGKSNVYAVGEVTRTEEGAVQARIYHANRQTPLLIQHVEGDQWVRLGARGGKPPTVADDLGPLIDGGAEGEIYLSLDGQNVYKNFRLNNADKLPDFVTSELECLNKYYGEGFATALLEDGRAYIKMKRLDGVSLGGVAAGSLPADTRALLDEALASMEAKGILHNDLQLKNFLYSARDKKVYPVDIQSLDPEVLAGDQFLHDMTWADYRRHKAHLQAQFDELIGQ